MLIATGVDTPLGIVLGGVSVGFGQMLFSKCVAIKLKKRDSLTVLGLAKFSSITLIISKALSDSRISVEEIKHVQSNVDYK